METKSDTKLKLAVLGPAHSGKTSFCHRVSFDTLPRKDQHLEQLEIYNKNISLGGNLSLRLLLYDIDG